MSSKQPRKIYRYQKINARTVESLCCDHLYFADPTALNDPLDCQPRVKSDSDSKTLGLILVELIRRRVESETLASLEIAKLKSKNAAVYAKKLGEQTAKNELVNIANHANNRDFEGSIEENECRLLNNNIQGELLRHYDRGVCCFSSAFKNPLLWSHYGDQHRGVCIGYDLNRDPKPKLHRVKYGGNRLVLTSLIAEALLNNDDDSRKLLDSKVLLQKASPWRYECEWRLLGGRGLQNSPLLLKDVTFGLSCPDYVIYAIIKALEPREVKFYQMYEDLKSFKLKRRPFDNDEIFSYFPRTAISGVEMFGPIDED